MIATAVGRALAARADLEDGTSVDLASVPEHLTITTLVDLASVPEHLTITTL